MTPLRNRISLPRSERAPVAAARRVGPADPHQRIEVTILLRRRSQPNDYPKISQMGARLPKDRLRLTREQFASTHGADPDAIANIRKFASDFGLQVVSEHPGRRSVVLAGTVEAFSRAFEVELTRYEYPQGSYRGRTGSLTIPVELSGVIEGVFGLDDRPQVQPHFRIRKELAGQARPRVPQGGYDPTQVAQAYNFPTGLDGSGQSIAILELGGGYRSEDLNAFFANLQLPSPKVTPISVDGAANSPTGDPFGPDGEVELDIEVAGAIAPGA